MLFIVEFVDFSSFSNFEFAMVEVEILDVSSWSTSSVAGGSMQAVEGRGRGRGRAAGSGREVMAGTDTTEVLAVVLAVETVVCASEITLKDSLRRLLGGSFSPLVSIPSASVCMSLFEAILFKTEFVDSSSPLIAQFEEGLPTISLLCSRLLIQVREFFFRSSTNCIHEFKLAGGNI